MANGQQDPRDLDEVWSNFMEARTKLLQSMLDFVHAAQKAFDGHIWIAFGYPEGMKGWAAYCRNNFSQQASIMRQLPKSDRRQLLLEAIAGLTGITDQMLQGKPTVGAAMLRFHQWLDQVWPAGKPLTIIAHNAEFDVSFLDAAEHVYDPTASGFDCRWLCTKEMSWELNPQKRHHRVTDLIADYHIGDTEEHRALADAIQEQMIYQALCREATTRGKWIER